MGYDNDQNRDEEPSDHRRRHLDSSSADKHRFRNRERSYERENDRDERERRNKRKERGDSEDRGEKRSRVSDDVAAEDKKHRSKNRVREGSDEREEERDGLADRRNKREERGGKSSRVSDDVADDNKKHRYEREEYREEREGLAERRNKREERGDRDSSRVSDDVAAEDKKHRSKNRVHEGSDEREEEREGLADRRNKREERGEKSYGVSDDVAADDKKRRSKNRVESDEREDKREERGEKKSRVSDDVAAAESKKHRRRFGDRADPKDGNGEDVVKKEDTNGDDAKATSFTSVNGQSRPISATSLAPIRSPATKVSSILTINENKGVNIIGSHEVPGKSSTDGTSSIIETRTFSLDALAKAKKALQMRMSSEKLKNLPLTSKKNTSSEAKLTVGSKEGAKGPSTGSGLPPAPVSASSVFSGSIQSGLKAPDLEAVKRAQEVALQMGFRQDPHFAPIINMFPGHMPAEVTIQPKPSKAPVLRLDALGREIDEQGNLVNTSKIANLSTLKVNINKQKKEAFQILKPELDVDPEKNPHFDPRMGIDSKKLLRPKKSSFQFVDEGKWSRDAEIIKLKSQFGEAQAKELRVKQAQLAKAKAEPDINPNLIEVSERVTIKEKPKEVIPKVEWWDQPLLQSGTYDDIADGIISEDQLKMEKITIYVEHPRPIEPPAEPAPPPPQPLKLTKKEQKKLRTQRRLAREKDRQEMIRQGLVEPPKAKVRMSNLMKVLGSEATQDPTKLEMEIRSAAAEREQAHVDRNIARKLTPDERREKRERKLFGGDPSSTDIETIVSVYKINDLSPKKFRFKIDVNAQENRLTGSALISDGISVVVVEGGNKSIKRYGKLMLRRIDWAAPNQSDEVEEVEEKPLNRCVLVWQGSVAKSSFHRFSVHECRTEAAARKILNDAGVGHYWDLAVNFTEDV